MANRACWSDDQSANSGVVGLMGQLMVEDGVMIRWPTVWLVS